LEIPLRELQQKRCKMTVFYDAATEKAWSQYYSFEFMINEEPCDTWYDPDKHKTLYDCDGDTAECLADLVHAIVMLIYHHAEECGFDTDELYKFAYKHLKAYLKVEKELAKSDRKVKDNIIAFPTKPNSYS
jgi:hypothetical protein